MLESIQFFGIRLVDFNWHLVWIVLAIFIATAGLAYYLYVWLYGRMKLGKEGSKEAKELQKQLKGKSKEERKAALKDKSSATKRMVFWEGKFKKIITPVLCGVLVICMIAVPVLSSVGEILWNSIFNPGGDNLNLDSPAAQLAMQDARKNIETIEGEGAVLAKNDNDVLPLDSTAVEDKKINMFGSSIYGMIYGGGGSCIFVTNATVEGRDLHAVRLEKALKDEGFEYNENLYNLTANYYESRKYSVKETSYDISCQYNCYANGGGYIGGIVLPNTYELPLEAYNKTFDELGGKTVLQDAKEYSDIAMYSITRIGTEGEDLSSSYFELTALEKSIISMLRENFSRVIILINSACIVELDYLNEVGVDSVLWIGYPGLEGNVAVAKIISGKTNPSGRFVDTWVKDVESVPSSVGFGLETPIYDNYYHAFQVYYEGIYVGYRYFVTRAKTDNTFNYDDYVTWSFGHGLSYTTFEKHITEHKVEDGKVSIQVAVTNTGNVAGKEVVQIYVHAPYTNGGVEKAWYSLAGFAKTDVIEPGETYNARVEFDLESIASYDSTYGNGRGSYVLEKGEYEFSLRDNVWDATRSEEGEVTFNYTVSSDVAYLKDSVTGTDVKNRFQEIEYGPNDEKVTYLSRSDWTGTMPSVEKINKTASASVRVWNNVDNTDNQLSGSQPKYGQNNMLVLKDLRGKDYNDSDWDKLLDQMSLEDQFTLVDNGGLASAEIKSVGKKATVDKDGPASGSVFGVGHTSAVVVASTWNTECALLHGRSVGKDGTAIGITGWYAPGANIHRNPMGGRNFEYFSEDPLISGLMSANTVKGANEYGLVPYVKHYALNDQETYRQSGIQVWTNEQGLREIYLKAFEYTVKVGGAIGIMSAFTKVGVNWSGSNHALMTEVLRDEWGFKGAVITDWVSPSLMPTNAGLRGGNDLWLYKNGSLDAKAAYQSAPHDMALLLRESCHRILYAYANSNCVWEAEDYEKAGISLN